MVKKRTKIWQTTYRVTVLSEDHPVSDNVELPDVLADCTDGDLIGDVEMLGRKEVHPRWVRRKLLAMGNDGEFFMDYATKE